MYRVYVCSCVILRKGFLQIIFGFVTVGMCGECVELMLNARQSVRIILIKVFRIPVRP